MILFIASNLSIHSTDPRIPFSGRSGQIFNKWLSELHIGDYSVVNVSDVVTTSNRPLKTLEYNLGCLRWICKNHAKIIALGKTAEKALTAIAVKYFTLPHPSPKNRALNDKKRIETLLRMCNNYINHF